MLIQLPSGSWINPEYVIAVYDYIATGECKPFRVVYSSGHDGIDIFEDDFETEEDAIKYRDTVAGIINAEQVKASMQTKASA